MMFRLSIVAVVAWISLGGGAVAQRSVFTFDEPGFPVVDAPYESLPPIADARVCADVASLIEALAPGRARDHVLLWRHGAAFPSEAWGAFVAFLQAGGSFLHLGGAPFTRPVVGPPGERRVEPRSLAMLKALGLNQCDRIAASKAALRYEPRDIATPATVVPKGGWVDVLEPRLTSARDYDDEDGSAGPRDAVLRPLAFLRTAADDRFPFATAAYAIDRFRGPFAGGRWTFRLVSAPLAAGELGALLDFARRQPIELRVDPDRACMSGTGAMTIRVHRALGSPVRKSSEMPCAIRITGPDGESIFERQTTIAVLEHAVRRVEFAIPERPGVYRIHVDLGEHARAVTGFWRFDRALFESGDEIRFDDYTLRRNGKPAPVIGTTVMSSTVHRKFLFEPNVADWDDTFRELSDLGVNLVRTGIWTGYRKISLDSGHVDPGFLNALEAYYLTARKHGILVVFTFFAFVPPGFGAKSPYFDPRAIEGQRALVGEIAGRFRKAKGILWDLINEPSFADPNKLWLCRPSGDPHELRRFRDWLRERYGNAEAGGTGWEDVVRRRWRLAPNEPIGLPTDDDFVDRNVFERHRPLRARDYLAFAQHAFARWAREMAFAIRDSGSQAPITVGQDEGGLNDRPHPQIHASEVDFTAIHSWWYNDALLWDSLMAKHPKKPMLVSESGIMQRELLTGEALRTPESFARLLSRKIGYAFAGRAFGLVQWCYDVNPYMPLDNEVAIGLRRVDRSYKPEHRVFRAFASFVARNRERFERPKPADVVLVLPHMDLFSPRGLQVAGTKRAVHVLCELLGRNCRVVSSLRLAEDLGRPTAIILPACRGISTDAWLKLKAAVATGATLLCSGWFERDDAGNAAHRLGTPDAALGRRELAEVEPYRENDWSPALRFPIAITQSAYAADVASEPRRIRFGRGTIVHHPAPIEWSEASPAQAAWYAEHLPPIAEERVRANQGVRIHWLDFERARLAIMINVTSKPRTVTLRAPAGRFVIPAGAARMFMFDDRYTLLDRSHPAPAPTKD